LDLDSLPVRKAVAALKEIDEQLAYLAVLTAVGSKPLSRWEKPLADEQNAFLGELDLPYSPVPRTLLSGKIVTETVFGRSPSYVQMYQARFANTPIDKSPTAQRCEGFLFGFPPCCVEAYIQEPYQKNDLDPEEQKILFHWACKGCLLTPLLLPEYRKIYQFVAAL
jgi:hypothetical protein